MGLFIGDYEILDGYLGNIPLVSIILSSSVTPPIPGPSSLTIDYLIVGGGGAGAPDNGGGGGGGGFISGSTTITGSYYDVVVGGGGAGVVAPPPNNAPLRSGNPSSFLSLSIVL